MVMERPRSTRPRGRTGARSEPAARRGRRTQASRLALTPTRTMVAIALGGSTVFVAWGLVARDASQIPLLVAGLVVYGIVFGALGLGGAVATYRAATDGDAGRSFVLAVAGGVAAILSAASLASAIVLALMWGGAG